MKISSKDAYIIAHLQRVMTEKLAFKSLQQKGICFVTPWQLANALTVSTKTLQRWRRSGEGPKFERSSYKRFTYAVESLDEWVSATSKRSLEKLRNQLKKNTPV